MRPRPRTPVQRLVLGHAVGIGVGVGVALLGPGCAGPSSVAATAAPEPDPGPVDPSFAPAFEALSAAVEAHEDELARRILTGVMARRPRDGTLRRAEAFERVLEGRRLASALLLRIAEDPTAEPAPDGALHLVLEAEHGLSETMRVRTAPGVLKLLLNGLDPEGFEQRTARTVSVAQVADFEVAPGLVTRIELDDYELRPGTALAVRGRWELTLLSGELHYRGATYPANEIAVAPFSAVRLAAFLPTGEVEPTELVRYLSGDVFSTEAMLERAVRIDPERRSEALDLLTPLVLDMPPLELERTVPALRWLSGARHLGGDPASWQQWMRARSERRAQDREDGALSLPERVAG